MQLFVRGLDGHSFVLSTHGIDTVADLKTIIEAKRGIPAAEQLLTAHSRVLADSETLACTGLHQDSTVQLLLRLCGGKGGFGALLRGQGRDGKITDNFDACRDLSGRRIRHVEAEKKLEDWKKEAEERELEKIAMKHMKELAKQAKQERDFKINVEEVKREHKKAADAVVEAVNTALTEGLQRQSKNGGSSSSKPGNGAAAAAAGSSKAAAAAAEDPAGDPASPGSKRKAEQSVAAAAAAAAAVDEGSPAKKRKKTMLDMLDVAESDEGSSSSSGESDEE